MTSTTNVLQLRRLSDVELRKSKTFSDSDIEKGKWNEKEYRRFWNLNVKKGQKTEILAKRLQRCPILEAEAKKIQDLEKKIEKAEKPVSNSDTQVPKTKMATISKNIQRVREAKEKTKKLRENFKWSA